MQNNVRKTLTMSYCKSGKKQKVIVEYRAKKQHLELQNIKVICS